MHIGNAEAVLNEIAEHLKAFYKWPAVFVVEDNHVEALSQGATGWYTYDMPIGRPVVMFEGIRDAEPDKLVELRFAEVSIRHLRSYEAMFDFFDTTKIHVYEAVPMGRVVRAYATVINGELVPTDVSQLRQFTASRLRENT